MIQAVTHARSLTHVCHIPLCVSEQSDHTSHFILTGHYSARVFTSMSTSHPPIAPPIEPLAALKIHPPPITYSETMPPPSTAPRKRKLVPSTAAASSPSTASGEAEDEDPEYAPEPSTSKRAAKSKAKAGPGRALSREALRKANHSMIERRRREKINAALGELRQMVPGLGDSGGKGGEFKLEVSEVVEHVLMSGSRADSRAHA